MSKDKKNGYLQIKYVDNLLYYYGIKGINDYETSISTQNLSLDSLKKINDTMKEFKGIFPTKTFNLSRKNFKIDSTLLAISFLKNCLSHIGANYTIERKNNTTYLHLKPINKVLMFYIEQKNMSDIEHIFMNGGGSGTITEVTKGRDIERISTNNSKTLVKIKENHISVKNMLMHCRLKLNVNALVKKIILESLPCQYTYELYFNDKKVMESKLENDKQVFELSNEILDFYKTICVGSYRGCLIY